MATSEFEKTQRTIQAPLTDVFARLADVEGHNQWMAKKGGVLRQTKQTSSGPVGVGTTYEDSDEVRAGRRARSSSSTRRAVWCTTGGTRTSSGRTKFEGWPGYTLEAVSEGETLVRHDAKLKTYGIYRHRDARADDDHREEGTTAVLDSLQKSFQ